MNKLTGRKRSKEMRRSGQRQLTSNQREDKGWRWGGKGERRRDTDR